MTQGIYKIAGGDTVYYVGQSRTAESRLRAHRRSLENGSHFNPYLQRCFGLYDFTTWTVVEEVDDVEGLTEREMFWITELSSKCNLKTPGPDDHWVNSPETRRRMGESRKRFLESLSEAERVDFLGRWRKGKPAWNSGQSTNTDDRLVEVGKAVSKAKTGRPNGQAGRSNQLKGQSKSTVESIQRQADSLRNRPLLPCPHCGQEVKVLKRHYHYCKGL